MNEEPFTSAETAAPDINVLISYLMEHDTGRFLYRGQVKDYPAPLVPSIFRGMLNTTERYGHDSQPNPKTLRSLGRSFFGNYVDEMSRLSQSAAKGTSGSFIYHKMLFERMLDIWGYMLGSTLAQHYGIRSGFLDVSTDVNIAAFFATHSAPFYEPMNYDNSGPSADPLKYGIIYRFNRFDSLRAIPDLDEYNYWNAPGTIVPGEILLHLEDDITLEDSWQHLRYFYEMFKASSERCWSLLKIPRESVANSRVGRQKAAFLVPDEIHEWASPNKYTVGPIFGEVRLNLEPELRLQAIEDLGAREGTIKYYFKQTGCTSVMDINSDYLWPNKEDYLLHILIFLVSNSFSNYIESEEEIPNGHTFLDPGGGRTFDSEISSLPRFVTSWDDCGLAVRYASQLPHMEARLTYFVKKAAILCSKGYLMQHVELLRSTIGLLQETISIDTDSVVLLLLKSMIHHDLGEHEDGGESFNKAMDIVIRDTINVKKGISEGIEILKRIAQDLGRIRLNPQLPRLIWEYYQSF